MPRSLFLILPLILLITACGPREFNAASTPIPLTPTPESAIAPDDTDGDGVANTADLCEGFITGASEVDETGCATVFDPYVNLTYNHEPHELWYGRFWTGSCENVPGFCLPGDPAWTNVTLEIAEQFPPDEQGVVRNRLWAVGRAVGFDWSSDEEINTDKAITTGQLRQWGNALQSSDDLPTTLTEIENEVCELLGADALEGDFSPAENCA
jgi:hypothetical protein